MKRSLLLANRMREVLLNGHWIANTNFKELLLSIDWKQANQKIASLNTIAALTFHINYYLSGLLRAFEKGELDIHDKLSFELPAQVSEAAWKELVTEFISNSERFCEGVEALEDTYLDEPFVDANYGTVLRNIEGVIEHSYYHLGQISLIRKWLLQKET